MLWLHGAACLVAQCQVGLSIRYSLQLSFGLSGKHDFAVPDLVGQEAYSPCIAIIFSLAALFTSKILE